MKNIFNYRILFIKLIFGTVGIRGRFNEEITYSLAYYVSHAMGLTVKNDNPI